MIEINNSYWNGASVSKWAKYDNNGKFYNGIWYGGDWNEGQWFGGKWKSGMWNTGIWYNGIHDHQPPPRSCAGTWRRGTWLNGTWEKGLWFDGDWLGGIWKQGFLWDFTVHDFKFSYISPKSYCKPQLTLSLNAAVYECSD